MLMLPSRTYPVIWRIEGKLSRTKRRTIREQTSTTRRPFSIIIFSCFFYFLPGYILLFFYFSLFIFSCFSIFFLVLYSPVFLFIFPVGGSSFHFLPSFPHFFLYLFSSSFGFYSPVFPFYS
uniref:Uncharacterized protein n=1 Tax=Cacopsylla melanoneura TaxID=428564 RepID=A0A8D8VS87_9HEMI